MAVYIAIGRSAVRPPFALNGRAPWPRPSPSGAVACRARFGRVLVPPKVAVFR